VFNSSIERFIRSFSLLDRYLGHSQRLPRGIQQSAQDIDRLCYPGSEWRSMIDYLIEPEP
jgi:hypothetical protein